MKGSDRMYGEQDVQILDDFLQRLNAPIGGFVIAISRPNTRQILNCLRNSRKEICKDVALHQGVIRCLLSTPGASLIIHDESDAQKTMGMIAPWMAGIKGSWMSHAYLFSEWHNSALGYTENIYSKWLEEVYKQLAEANRAMGDRKCECEAWELKMHTIVKLVPVSVIIKTKDGKRDITELSRSFASMKVPDEGWLITNDGW